MNKKTLRIIGIEIEIEIAILIIAYKFINSKFLEMLPQCWVYNTTGLLCPACGGTRCITYLLNGNWMKAFFSHMVFFIVSIYLILVNILYLINLNREKKLGIWIYPKVWYVIIFAVALIIYTIVRNLL